MLRSLDPSGLGRSALDENVVFVNCLPVQFTKQTHCISLFAHVSFDLIAGISVCPIVVGTSGERAVLVINQNWRVELCVERKFA